MKIHLPTYPPGVHQIVEDSNAGDLKLDGLVFRQPIHANLLLDRHDPYLQFTFRLRTAAHLECDRCLAEYELPIEISAPMIYVLGRTADQKDLDDPDIGYIPTGATDIDITTDLRDFLLLAIPGKHLCRDSCKGLCPSCGADLNAQQCSCIIQ